MSLLSRVGEANRLVLIQDILDDCKSDFYFIRHNYCHPGLAVCAPRLWNVCRSQIKFTVSSSDLLSYIKKRRLKWHVLSVLITLDNNNISLFINPKCQDASRLFLQPRQRCYVQSGEHPTVWKGAGMRRIFY